MSDLAATGLAVAAFIVGAMVGLTIAWREGRRG